MLTFEFMHRHRHRDSSFIVLTFELMRRAALQNAPRAQTATGSTGGRALRLNASAGLTLPSWGAPRRSMSSSAPRADLVLQRTAQRMEILMAEIRALGHIPRDHRGLAQRVRRALRQSLLSDSQLAELAFGRV